MSSPRGVVREGFMVAAAQSEVYLREVEVATTWGAEPIAGGAGLTRGCGQEPAATLRWEMLALGGGDSCRRVRL